MAYLSLSQKLSINRIGTTTSGGHPAGGCSHDEYQLNLEMGNHVSANPGSSVPFSINRWKDSSGNSRDFVQSADAQMPRWTGYGYNFDGGNENLTQVGTADAITLEDDFTIGFAIKVAEADVANLVTIADASSANDFIRLKNTEQIEVKADGQLRTVDLNAGLPNGDPVGIVITRTSDSMRLYVDGVAQTDTAVFSSGKALDIDTVGCRNSQINDFIGDIGQIIIYSCAEMATVNAVIDTIDDTRVQMIQ